MPDPKPVPLLGRLAVHLKMISMDQLAEAVREQGRAGEEAKLGEILVARGFIDRGQLAKLIAAQQQVLAKQKGMAAPAAAQPVAPVRSAAPARAPAARAPAPVQPPAPSAPAAPRTAQSAPRRDDSAPAAGPAPIGSAADLAAPTDADRAR